MPVTYTPIATTTVTGSSTTTITFSSIPATYTDLVLVANYRAVSNNYLMLRFNGDTGTNYTRTEIDGYGTSIQNYNGNNEAYAYITSIYAYITESAMCNINIMNYANTTTFKTVLSRANSRTIGTGAAVNMWRSTAAINTILVTPIGSGFDINSTFSLYGIKAA